MFRRIHHPDETVRFREHFDGPHIFTVYVEGRDGAVKVEVDKATGMLAANGVLAEAYVLLAMLGNREVCKEAFSEDGKYICISGNDYATGEYREVWVNIEQLFNVIEENMMCRFLPGRICRSTCHFWFSPGQGDAHCIYASHPMFRRFVKDIDKYVCDFVVKKKRLVCSTVRFRIDGLKRRVRDPLGNLRTRREMLGHMLAEMGHKVKIEKNGTLIAEKRYTYLPTEGYTIRINKNGSGLVKTSSKVKVLTPDNIGITLCTKHLILIEAMRCLFYHLDDKTKIIPPSSATPAGSRSS